MWYYNKPSGKKTEKHHHENQHEQHKLKTRRRKKSIKSKTHVCRRPLYIWHFTVREPTHSECSAARTTGRKKTQKNGRNLLITN